jgi:HlyD family secretion protein
MSMKKIVTLIIVVAVAGAGAFAYWQTQGAPRNYFRYAEVHRGRLVATVGSTGTLMPREIVDVGAQVAGRIIAIGADPNSQSKIVDWGSAVVGPTLDSKGNIIKTGTVLAQIDPDLFDAQVKSADAGVKSAQADYEVKKAALNQATFDWGRAQVLYNETNPKGIAKAEYDSAQAAFGSATAQLAVSAANINVAKAQLKMAQTNFNYTTIMSPVDGVIIDRRVNVGQTVVSSLSAPSLFLIAKDLSKMEVWATVNEVDVGKIQVDQKVKFTVDALPGKTFHGTVVPQGKFPFRFNVSMNQNVVTYTAVVSADNSSGMFRPYWTTNLSFIVADKPSALLVPNAALRWQPSKQQMSPAVAADYAAQRAKKPSSTNGDILDHGFVWVKGDDGLCQFIHLQLGQSDTVNTEVVGVVGGGDLPEKTQVITGESRTELPSAGASPFVASPFSTKKKEGN